ncbi:MAG: choice-of-anchor Q domain-containing protein [Bacteroidales bacterium]
MTRSNSTCRKQTFQILLPVLLSVLSFILTLSTFATSVTVSGNVSGTWSADTVFIDGNLIVPLNETLKINPGTIVEFKGYFRLEVIGQLLALGTYDDTIVFTRRDTSNFGSQSSGRGGWSGIRFAASTAGNDSSLFSFCSFKFGKAVEDSANCFGGAIQIKDYSKIRLSDCLFYHNYSYYSGGAIFLWNADIKVEHCVFKANYSGNTGTIYGYGGGLCSLFSSPVMIENEFYSNTSTGVGGGVSFDNSDPVFNNNILKNNFSALGGAFGVLRSALAQAMVNNLVVNNEAQFFGGGICCIRSFPLFSNLTISGNQSSYGGGFYCNDSAVPSMYNSIIWGNSGLGTSVYIWDVRSAPNFYYCNIEGDTTDFEGSGGQEGYHGSYENNINKDPLFSVSNSHLYSLLSGSSCIDSGMPDSAILVLPSTDLGGDTRIYNNRIDMGAYEYHGTEGVSNIYQSAMKFLISPNPFKTQTQISLYQKDDAATKIIVSDIQGNKVRHFHLIPNNNSVIWDGKNDIGKESPKGVYLMKVITPEGIIIGKIVKSSQ